MINIAVYGTLKKGLGNHAAHLTGAEFLGNGVTKEPLRMFDTGGFPVVFHGAQAPIRVECYGVTTDQLIGLDQLEWNGRMFVRTKHQIIVGAHQSTIECMMYLGVEEFWKRKMTGLREVLPVNGLITWHPYAEASATGEP